MYKRSNWTYYSRNKSYSRSYNASIAEKEGRFPRTRSAQKLGLSLKAFNEGYRFARKSTIHKYRFEWHHVGKYAMRVQYMNVPLLLDDLFFWIGSLTNRNKSVVNRYLNLIGYSLYERKESSELIEFQPKIGVGYKFHNKSKIYDEISTVRNGVIQGVSIRFN